MCIEGSLLIYDRQNYMKTSFLYKPVRVNLNPFESMSCTAKIGPVYKTLLQNKKLTTELLERITAAPVSSESYNSIRGSLLYRSAILTAEDQILLFARSIINASLLSTQCLQSILDGRIPLGRILHEHNITTDRDNFTYFSLGDPGYLSFLFSQLAIVSPGFRQWRLDKLIQSSGRTGFAASGNQLPPGQIQMQDSHYWGRIYDIFFQGQKLARIEETFSPDLQAISSCG